MPSFSVSACLDNLENRDKDKRFMGLNDLLSELEKVDSPTPGKGVLSLSESDERRLVRKVLDMLPDKSSTVQEQAVKAVGPLSFAVRDSVCADICKTLTQHLLFVCDIGDANSKKQAAEELRDIASIGIKNVIAAADVESAPQRLISRLVPAFLSGLSEKADNQEVVGFVMEGLFDLLSRFAPHGKISAGDSAKVLKAVQPHLGAKRTLTRKRAIGSLGLLASTVPDALFAELMKHLIESMTASSDDAEQLRTYIQAVTTVSRAVGFRLGKYLPKVVPLLIKAVENEAFEEEDDLRESAFSCFETMLLRCHKDVSPYVDDFIRLGLQFVKHDPNYEDEDEDEEMGDAAEDEDEDMGEDGEDEEEEDEYDDELSDDDDMSWKVRRAAAKVLGAIVETRRERLLKDIYGQIAPALVKRFGEREENVRLDVYSTFASILQQTRSSTMEEKAKSEALLEDIAAQVVSNLAAQLKLRSTSVKGRSGVFSLLRELLTIRPTAAAISSNVSKFVPGLEIALGPDGKTDANLKIDALIFLRELLHASDPSLHVSTLGVLGPLVCTAASDSYYRISAEGLKTATTLVPVVVAARSDANAVVEQLANAVLAKLDVQDIDQEVKDAAISCTGALLSRLGNHAAVAPRVGATLSILRQRLRNEITRLTAVRCVGTIAESSIKFDLSEQMANFLSELSGFLRKANRQLKQASLVSLRSLITNYGAENAAAVDKVVGAKEGKHHLLKNLAPLISDSDLQLSHQALLVAAAVVKVNDSAASCVANHAAIIDNCFGLLRSVLLQGLALSSLVKFFSALVESHAASFKDLLDRMRRTADETGASGKAETAAAASATGEGSGARVILGNVAKAMAALATASEGNDRSATIKSFQDSASKDAGNAAAARSAQLALLALGESGRRLNASEFPGLWDTALKALSAAPAEETKQAASFALGSIAVGNVAEYLPKLLSEVQAQSDDAKYLLLHALREVIVGAEEAHADVLREREGEILPLLFSHCEIENEVTRNVVAECLGKLALGSPQGVLEKLVASVNEASGDKWRTRATAVTAVKFMVVDQHKFAAAAAKSGQGADAHGVDAIAVDSALQQHVGVFADQIKDTQLDVRRAALLLLNFAAHHSPHLLRSRLSTLLPLIYSETAIRPELVREVDLGPFKHKVDDGLDNRKAAFETMYTLLDTCPDAVASNSDVVQPFMAALTSGLRDTHDIRVLTHLVLVRLARVAGTAIIADGPAPVDAVVEPVRETLSEKPKDGAVKQDVDRIEERVRTGLRAVAALESVSGIREVSSKFDEFVRWIQSGDLAANYDNVKNDGRPQAAGGLSSSGSFGLSDM